ncbi:hypothetical protein GN956_G15366 [Arapaima gigas]
MGGLDLWVVPFLLVALHGLLGGNGATGPSSQEERTPQGPHFRWRTKSGLPPGCLCIEKHCETITANAPRSP